MRFVSGAGWGDWRWEVAWGFLGRVSMGMGMRMRIRDFVYVVEMAGELRGLEFKGWFVLPVGVMDALHV